MLTNQLSELVVFRPTESAPVDGRGADVAKHGNAALRGERSFQLHTHTHTHQVTYQTPNYYMSEDRVDARRYT